MSDIVEILGEKKFNGSKNTDLKTIVLFEENQKNNIGGKRYGNINKQNLFISEKNNSQKYRLYGKITPVLNNKPQQRYVTNFVGAKQQTKNLELTTKNWFFLTLAPNKIVTGFDVNGVEKYAKGMRRMETHTKSLSVDLTEGLPAKTAYDTMVDEYFGIVCTLGHNFSAGDTIYLHSLKVDDLPSGVYKVVTVRNNIIYLNVNPKLLTATKDNNIKLDTTNLLELAGEQNVDSEYAASNDLTVVAKLKFKKDFLKKLSEPRYPVSPIIEPDFYVSKILNKEKLQYYIKTLEVVNVINSVDDCAFSKNFYSQPIKTFIQTEPLDITNKVDNLNMPLTNVYLGIIKKHNGNLKNFSDIESHLSLYVDSVAENDGIEKISKVSSNTFHNIAVGDIFYHSLCEFSQEELTETEIMKFNHFFTHNDISYNYVPFHPIKLKLVSDYIEEGDNVYNMPPYAVYSRQRDKHIWRDIFENTLSVSDGEVLDFPFLNGHHYVFNDVTFFLNTQKRNTAKYVLNLNDITNGKTVIDDLLSDITQELTDTEEKEFKIKPYKDYKDNIC